MFKDFSSIFENMYMFPVAAITNCYKHSGLTQHTFIPLQFWRSEVQRVCHWIETCVSSALLPLETLENKVFPCLFLLLGLQSLAHRLLLHLSVHQHSDFKYLFCHHISFSLHPSFLIPPSHKDAYDCIYGVP